MCMIFSLRDPAAKSRQRSALGSRCYKRGFRSHATSKRRANPQSPLSHLPNSVSANPERLRAVSCWLPKGERRRSDLTFPLGLVLAPRGQSKGKWDLDSKTSDCSPRWNTPSSAGLQHDSVGWCAALLPSAPACRRPQCPSTHRHSRVLGLGRQLPAHLTRDSWPLGKGVVEALVWGMEGILDSFCLWRTQDR